MLYWDIDFRGMVFAPGGAGQSALAVGLAFSLSKRTRLCAGLEHFFIKANVLFCVPKENQKSTSDFDALDPRERGCSPLSDPEGVVETEKS